MNDMSFSEFPVPSVSRHSSSATHTRRSSASTVISASRYEPDAPTYRDFVIREIPDDDEGAVPVMGEFLIDN